MINFKLSKILHFVTTYIIVSRFEDVHGEDYSLFNEGILCPQCFHMNISLENVSPGAEDAAHAVLAKVYDPLCVEGDVPPTPCKNASSQNIMCGTIIFHARSIGLQNIYPAAVMDEMNVIRDCIVVNSTSHDGEDGCVDIHALSERARLALTSRFAEHRKSWNTTEFTDGRICLHDGKKSMTKTRHDETNRSSNTYVLERYSLLYHLLLTVAVYYVIVFI